MKKIFSLVIILAIFCSGLFCETIGLVLSGGGAKGAYEVGVWKAFEDYGLTSDVKAISGTSVGALNGALFACATVEETEKLWKEEVGFTSFLMPDTSSISEVAGFAVRSARNRLGEKNQMDDPYGLNDRLTAADSEFVRYLLDGITFIADTGVGLARGTFRYIAEYIFGQTHSDGLFTRNAMDSLIERTVSLKKINNSGIDVYATAIPKDGYLLLNTMLALWGTDSAHYFKLNEQVSDDNVYSILKASSSFPIVYDSTYLPEDIVEKGHKIGIGYEYIDGGFESVGGKNTPVEPVVNDDFIDKIFIVYLKSADEMEASVNAGRINAAELKNKETIEIIPSRDLGDLIDGTMNFNPDNISELIDLGYEDTCLILNENGYKKQNGFQKFIRSVF